MPTTDTSSRPRIAAIYAPGTVRGYRPPSDWTARADLTDVHPIMDRTLARSVWWIIETKD